MKLWFIKIGKAASVIRREGLIRGGRRVARSFAAMFQRVGSGDILFITGGLGDSALYRTRHVSESLASAGLRCSMTVQDNPFLPRYADRFSIFIFHRTLFTRSVSALIESAKKLGKEVIFETDDLVYDPQFLAYMDIYRNMNVFERKQYENGVGGEILADPSVRACTTTTEYLAGKLREKGKSVYIVRNQLSRQDVACADALLPGRQKSPDGTVRIAYFSGTKSHDKDFAVAQEAIASVMEKYPNTRLFLAGPLHTGPSLDRFRSRIDRLPYVDRKEHFANIARCDINIAPLEIGNPFCESKSELKFFEAGILEVPTVASATGTFKQAIEDGVDGFVATESAEWEEKLTRLVGDADLRDRLGRSARKKVLERYVTSVVPNEEYVRYLRSRLIFDGCDIPTTR